jgi:hypothetical protein
MRKSSFAIIFNARNSTQAEEVIDRLRQSGLHPADLALTATLPFRPASKKEFPIEVPFHEAEKAAEVLRASA